MKMHLSALGLLAAVALLAATAAASPTRAGVAATRAGAERYTGTIAFLRGPSTYTSQSLYVVHPDGSGLRRVTPPELPVDTYAWSPDGTQIAFIGADQGSLWLVHPDGTGLRKLLSGSNQASVDLSWSPDGKRIATISSGPNGSATTCAGPIYIVPIDGAQPRAVPGANAGCSVAWSPRGNEIAYGGGSPGVWVIHPDGSGRRQVSPNGWGGWVRWSADGKKLAYQLAITKHGQVIGRYDGIGDVDANGRHRRLVTRHADNEYPAAWSPRRPRILYGRAELGGIYTIGSDGRNNRRVTSDSPLGSLWPALAWSPDGRSIVYATNQTGNGDLYIVGAGGRGKVQLTNTADSDLAPSWVAGGLPATRARTASQGRPCFPRTLEALPP
jgi:TolB protein